MKRTCSRLRSLGLAWLAFLGCLVTAEGAAAQTEARVCVPVASVYASPSFGSERVTQVLLWDRVVIQKTSGDWARVLVSEQYRTPDGYPGWMQLKELTTGMPPLGPVVTVRISKTGLRVQPAVESQVVAWVYLATRLERMGEPQGDWLPVTMPGRSCIYYVKAAGVAPEGVLPTSDGRDVVESAVQLKGTPYLWGGMSSLGIDCSGLVYTVYRLHGYQLPRDADQQFEIGAPVARKDLMPGDLLFFGKSASDIRHVGIYMWQGKFVHASGSLGVDVSELKDYLYKYQGARRVLDTPQAERMRLKLTQGSPNPQ